SRRHQGAGGQPHPVADRRAGHRQRAAMAGRPVRDRGGGRPPVTSPSSGPPHETPVPDPIWRRDFPITAAGEDEVTRREFVRFLVLASGGFAAGNIGIALWSSLRSVNEGEGRASVALADVPQGTAYLFDYPTGADPAILVHLPGGELRAFSQKCKHLRCLLCFHLGRLAGGELRACSQKCTPRGGVVYFPPGRRGLECPCHEGFLDAASGAVLSGPPQRPLGRIDVEVRGRTVWALANLGERGHGAD